jgi:predicted MPP superfamily phosphohydrolase
MRNISGSILFLVIMLLVDLYVFQGLKTVGAQWTSRSKWLIFGLYWLVCGLCLALIAALPYLQFEQWQKTVRTYVLAVALGWIMGLMLVVPFLLVDDGRRLVQWVIQFFSRSASVASGQAPAEAISRSVFLSWLGLGVGGSLVGSLLYGFKNKYNYQVKNIKLQFAHMPTAFKGLRMVHISDIHSGSFMDASAVQRGIDLINQQKPDVILFTGDLVNDKATEMEPFIEIFQQLKAPMGVFSTFGNHDYGDYVRWESDAAKLANQQQLRAVHAQLGWRLLWDENVLLEKEGATIGLIGVQNISGKSRFHSYGNLAKAAAFDREVPFKVLLSHDPSHWESEVLQKFTDIDLTLSGHTHGMQFGVELPGFKFSPVQWMYRQWAGLYQQGTQHLYVNRGFGFIGYPGRVGILPEITVIDLV